MLASRQICRYVLCESWGPTVYIFPSHLFLSITYSKPCKFKLISRLCFSLKNTSESPDIVRAFYSFLALCRRTLFKQGPWLVCRCPTFYSFKQLCWEQAVGSSSAGAAGGRVLRSVVQEGLRVAGPGCCVQTAMAQRWFWFIHSAHRRGRGPFPCLLASLERPQTRCV